MEIDILLLGFVPAVVVAAISYLLIDRFLKSENQKHIMEVKRENVKHTTPIRLQAYERLTLLVDRIDPIKAVNRVIKPGMIASDIKQLAIAEIKNEFNHNVTQQIYVTGKAWESVVEARDMALKLITVTATQVPNNADAVEFSKKLIFVIEDLEQNNNEVALQIIRQEVKKIF